MVSSKFGSEKIDKRFFHLIIGPDKPDRPITVSKRSCVLYSSGKSKVESNHTLVTVPYKSSQIRIETVCPKISHATSLSTQNCFGLPENQRRKVKDVMTLLYYIAHVYCCWHCNSRKYFGHRLEMRTCFGSIALALGLACATSAFTAESEDVQSKFDSALYNHLTFPTQKGDLKASIHVNGGNYEKAQSSETKKVADPQANDAGCLGGLCKLAGRKRKQRKAFNALVQKFHHELTGSR